MTGAINDSFGRLFMSMDLKCSNTYDILSNTCKVKVVKLEKMLLTDTTRVEIATGSPPGPLGMLT